ncbi:MAG: ERAP1-like C-terminal domain-containing protein [Acidobacteriia bacterium]|nr:ERAP1-like C-terminal domain-containing protein [Terriglobia bacterium]
MRRILCAAAVATVALSLAAAQRLPEIARPENYKLTLTPDLENAKFEGEETVAIQVLKPTSEITLNAVDIDYHHVDITSSGTTQEARVTPQEDKEMVVLTVEKLLAPGAASIHITYSGSLNSEMRGFYLGKDDRGRKYAATQFEATDARRAFPSFDEPEYKATFDISAMVDKDMVAISNQRVASDTTGPGDKHTMKFATTAKMSSYLAALVVGNFEYLEGEADGIPIRVYSTPGKKQMGKFALESAEHILSYYDNYFGIKYPYGKLDLIGLPDFSAGAMENVGCITFREAILLIDERGSVSLKKAIASVISHEMAHQWFGDLVTMKWWDDVWLNEGFATWMSSKPLQAWRPEWNFALDDVSEMGRALNTDSLASTRPIHQAAETPSQILELFDGIAYGKAAAVLRMLEAYLGEETFRAGVNAYLNEHQYANATAADFWNAQGRTSKKPVDRIMPTFVTQAGVPIVTVKSQCSADSTSVTVTQRRYYYDRSKFEAANGQLWEIPLCFRGSAGKDSERCELLSKREETFTLSGCSHWMFANAGATGYYRVGYDPDTVRSVAREVESRLTPAERITLQADIWASVWVGREPVGDYLALAQSLADDRNRAVLEDLMGRLHFIGRYLVSDADGEAYRGWLRQYLNPMLKDVGWEPKPGESDEQRVLRGRVINVLGRDARDPEVLAQARKIADKYLDGPASVDRELGNRAFGLAALNGDQAFYERLKGALKNPRSPEEYYRYLNTLAQFTDPVLLERTLDYAISPDVRSQDSLGLVTSVLENPAGQKLAWDFVRQHWADVERAGGPFASAQVVAATSSFCDARMRDQVTDFFAAHKIEAAERTYRQSIERINNCADLKLLQEPRLASWLGQHGATGGE